MLEMIRVPKCQPPCSRDSTRLFMYVLYLVIAGKAHARNVWVGIRYAVYMDPFTLLNNVEDQLRDLIIINKNNLYDNGGANNNYTRACTSQLFITIAHERHIELIASSTCTNAFDHRPHLMFTPMNTQYTYTIWYQEVGETGVGVGGGGNLT